MGTWRRRCCTGFSTHLPTQSGARRSARFVWQTSARPLRASSRSRGTPGTTGWQSILTGCPRQGRVNLILEFLGFTQLNTRIRDSCTPCVCVCVSIPFQHFLNMANLISPNLLKVTTPDFGIFFILVKIIFWNFGKCSNFGVAKVSMYVQKQCSLLTLRTIHDV